MTEQELREHAEIATRARPGRWQLQTSNSFRRIGRELGSIGHASYKDAEIVSDGDILCAITHPHDRMPDLLAKPGVLEYIVAAQPTIVLALLDEIERMRPVYEAAKAWKQSGSGADPYKQMDLNQAIDAAMTKEPR